MSTVMMWLCLKGKSPYLRNFFKYIMIKQIYNATFIITKFKLGLPASTDQKIYLLGRESQGNPQIQGLPLLQSELKGQHGQLGKILSQNSKQKARTIGQW